MPNLENIPADEANDIAEIARLTIKQLERRYGGVPAKPILRGVHAKGHGCVTAIFKINDNLPENRRCGVFAIPGRSYEAIIRFSNANVAVTPDSPLDPLDKTQQLRVHGSRGMAIKLRNITGTPLLTTDGPLTQDFLMINQPVFAFANVKDYRALSEVLEKTDDPSAFFARMKDPDAEIARRARTTFAIVRRIQSLEMDANQPAITGAYQNPPASPLDNQYFGAAPFLFGPDRVMRISAQPEPPLSGEKPKVSDDDYLKTSLHKRLTAPNAREVVFKFQVQVRTADDLAGRIDTEIEDATVGWDAQKYPFEDVATITIPPQDFDTPERREECERLAFSPWNGLAEHRPLGGINRLRFPVYETASQHRLGITGPRRCPMSGIS